MKSKLMNQIKQAEHFLLIGPTTFALSDLKRPYETEKTLIVYIDGGLKHRRKIEKIPHLKSVPFLSAGDNDSSTEKCDILKESQDVSDLHFALELIRKTCRNVRSLKLYGFLSGTRRIDHLMINLGEVDYWCRKLPAGKNTVVSFENKLHFFPPGRHGLKINGLFSVLSFTENNIDLNGKCDFPYQGLIRPFSGQGLSNFGRGEIILKASKRFILFRD